jgi:hypothetical protein
MYPWRVPLTTFGDFRIVASQDIGTLGPEQSTSVTYHWSLARNLAWILARGMLILLLMLKPNRTWRAWMALLPAFLTAGFMSLLARFLYGMPVFLGDLSFLSSVPMGLGALWLLSYKVEALRGRRAFLTAAGILTVMCVVSGALYAGLNSFSPYMVVCVLGALAVLPAMAAARFFCRKRYSAPRFMSWLLLWLILIFTCLPIPFAVVVGIVTPYMVVCVLGALAVLPAMAAARFFCRKRYNAPRFMSWLLLWLILIFTCLAIPFAVVVEIVDAPLVLKMMPAVGAGIGLVMYIILLPFMLLTFLNSFYRARFYSIFRFENQGEEAGKEV